MGYYFATGNCLACGKLFTFNPHLVPSVSVNGAPREPVCQDCIEIANIKRRAKGIAELAILPGAYAPAQE